MLDQLRQLNQPIVISTAFFVATFFFIADLWSFTGGQIALGMVAGAIAGFYVLIDVLRTSAKVASDPEIVDP